MLKLENISFIDKDKVILKNVTYNFEKGKCYCITGPNGSGKSTLCKVIMGINKCNGNIIFNNKNITKSSINERANAGISYAFQNPIKFRGLNVYDLLTISSKKDLTRKEACQILTKVGLCAKEYVDREVNSSLSGGELKRIEIATILCKKNKLILLDEPEAGIDLWSFDNLIDIIKELKNEKYTIIIVSHQEKIINIADEVLIMNKGILTKAKDNAFVKKEKICCKKVNIYE